MPGLVCPHCRATMPLAEFGSRCRIGFVHPKMGCACPRCGAPVLWWFTVAGAGAIAIAGVCVVTMLPVSMVWTLPAGVLPLLVLPALNPWLLRMRIVRLIAPPSPGVVVRLLERGRLADPVLCASWVARQQAAVTA